MAHDLYRAFWGVLRVHIGAVRRLYAPILWCGSLYFL